LLQRVLLDLALFGVAWHLPDLTPWAGAHLGLGLW
jgi:hypothetical protein